MCLTTWVLSSDPDRLSANDPVLALVLNMPIIHYICIGCVWVMIHVCLIIKNLCGQNLHGHVQVVTAFETIKFQIFFGKFKFL